MKKHLLALAVLVAAGSASAQSSVTIFGVVDAAIAQGNGSVSDRTRLHNSGLSSSRFGLRGIEDLGGGMSAVFWLEGQLMNDDGTGQATNTNNQVSGGAAPGMAGSQGFLFNRRSTVSLSGNWGELRLGRDYTPQYWNIGIYDAFNNNGVGAAQTLAGIVAQSTAVRASNSIGYFTPGGLGGFYGQVMYYLGENPSGAANSDDGKGGGLRVGWSAGSFEVAYAAGYTNYAAADVKQSNLGAAWRIGDFKVIGQLNRDRVGQVDAQGYAIGGHWYVGAAVFRLSLSRYEADTANNPATRKLAVGAIYNLSKRTALYGTYARVKNSGGAAIALNAAVTAPNEGSSGFDLGVKHDF